MTPAFIEQFLSAAMQYVWRASWQASVLAILVLGIQALFSPRLGGRGRYLLWSIVLLRLLVPVFPESKFSIFNVAAAWSKAGSMAASAPLIPSPGMPGEGQGEGSVFQSQIATQKSAEPSPQPSPGMPGEGARTWLRMLPIAWLAGVIVLSLRVMLEFVRINRLVSRLQEISDQNLHQIIQSSAASLRLRKLPRALTGDAIRTPAVVGVFRPVLMLPAQVLESCNFEQIRLIVMHELAHLKRRDIFANWLLAAATVIHWFNPLVWLFAARVRADRELACDELVLASSQSSDVHVYGDTLLKLVELLSPSPRQTQAVGILESSAPLERRIRMIARFNPKNSTGWPWLVALFLVLGCTTLTDGVRGQATKPADVRNPVARANRNSPAQSLEAIPEMDLRAQLQRVMPEVYLDNVSFVDSLTFFRDVSSANFVIQWRALEMAGIDRNAQVSLRLKQVTVAQALTHLLRDVGGGSVRLGYEIDNGAIVISTEEDIGSHIRSVFYDIGDLIVSAEGKALSGKEFDQKVSELKELIQQHVAAESWKDKGGNVGTITAYNTKLAILQTAESHEQISVILTKLRERPTTQPRTASSN